MAEKKVPHKDHHFSKAVRAGKRTYFFDVKSTRNGDHYLTITESKRRFNNEQGKFYYEKFKVFLYKEDFAKFKQGLEESINFVNTENGGTVKESARIIEHGNDADIMNVPGDSAEASLDSQNQSDFDFEDLGPFDHNDEKNKSDS